MVKIEANKLIVDFHEWAWSLRTQGFPVYAVTKNGEKILIGGTVKKRTVYDLPPDTIAVLRRYYSNAGYLTVFVYLLDDDEIHEIILNEQNNFEGIESLPELVKEAIKELWVG